MLRLVKKGPAKISDIVARALRRHDLPPQLVEAASWQVHAHLLKLKADGKVVGASRQVRLEAA